MTRIPGRNGRPRPADAPISRRRLLGAAVTLGAAAPLAPWLAAPGLISPARAAPPQTPPPEGPATTRKIPKTGESLPVIGMGTWITFNVGRVTRLREDRLKVARAFFQGGGGMIDSSPMYGSSEAVVGWCLERLEETGPLFSATKVWTSSTEEGREQIADSERLWRQKRFDLLQVHNLVNWRAHLETLFAMKEQGRVRYVGVTTSHESRHGELERIMTSQPIDFVQITYNAVDRAAEDRILPLAAERGIAVIANRPYRGGPLVDRVQRHELPGWAAELGAANWPQVLLKFIVSHPALTCAIPATTRVVHMNENMGAARGPMPSPELRRRIARHVAEL